MLRITLPMSVAEARVWFTRRIMLVAGAAGVQTIDDSDAGLMALIERFRGGNGMLLEQPLVAMRAAFRGLAPGLYGSPASYAAGLDALGEQMMMAAQQQAELGLVAAAHGSADPKRVGRSSDVWNRQDEQSFRISGY